MDATTANLFGLSHEETDERISRVRKNRFAVKEESATGTLHSQQPLV